MSVLDYDIVIVGAGMAGSALACALNAAAGGRSALRIALVEARPLRSGMPPCEFSIDGFDARVSALTMSSRRWLESLDLWSGIVEQRSCVFTGMQVWDAEGTGKIAFDAAEVRAPALGHIVENRVITSALLRHVRTQSAVHLYDNCTVQRLQLACDDVESQFGNTAVVELSNGDQLHSALVVAADGADSPLRGMADLALREWDYQHDAIVCTVLVEKPHRHTARQRFTPQGPLAFLPLPSGGGDQHYCSIVWSQTRAAAAETLALDDAAFCHALSEAFERRLGAVSAVSRRFCFPLRQRHAVDYVKPGFALVADAAHTIHPLAGQGINLGLADVAALAECVGAAHQRGQPLGDIARLRQYQRQRKGDNLAMMAAVEGFKRAFEPQPLPLRWLRNRGMHFLDGQRGIKRRIIRYAMGIS